MLDLTKAAEETTKSKKVNWDKLDVGIEYNGKAITLPGPPNMPLDKAIEALMRKKKDEDQEVRVLEWFDGYPHDAAVQFSKAMKNLYGWSSAVDTMTMFGPKPPQMLSIKTGFRDEDVVLCPMGSFELPGLDSKIETMIHRGPSGRAQFLVHGTFKQKQKYIVLELATEARRLLREESIYRGKAIRIGVNNDGELDLSQPPRFWDVSQPNILIFDNDIQEQINHSVLSPILYPEECSGVNVPERRNILVHGRYGCGKTLLMRDAARACVAVGRTFILIDRVQGLKEALEFGNFYAPALVSAEDIDRVTEVRDETANDLINTIDGVVSKTSRVMTILTTNFVDKIDDAMKRPGRLDAVIELKEPTYEAVQRLIRVYAGHLLDAAEDISEAAIALSGQIPAAIRECVDRAKLGMIWRRANHLTTRDLVVSAQTMQNHLALLNKPKNEKTPPEQLGEALRKVLGIANVDEVADSVLHARIMAGRAKEEAEAAKDAAEANGETLEMMQKKTLLPIKRQVSEIHDKTVN